LKHRLSHTARVPITATLRGSFVFEQKERKKKKKRKGDRKHEEWRGMRESPFE
jgi:hypothetical protein